MPTITTHAPGTLVWPELATSDYEGAKKFYTGLFGWGVNEQDIGGGEKYGMLRLPGGDVGALSKLRPEQASAGVPTHWNSYISVTSADETTARAKTLGATVLVEPFDVFDAGRMSVLQDPVGAVICLWQGMKHPGASVLAEPGALCWTELMSGDIAKSKAFYTGLIGWTAEEFPMGPTNYTVFRRGTEGAAGMMQITPEMGPMPSSWMPYFEVEDCDAAAAKATALGGKIGVPPTSVPMAGRFAVIVDPQGGHFGVIKSAPKS